MLKHGNWHVLVLAARYKKLKKAIPGATVASRSPTTILAKHWVSRYTIMAYLLAESGPQFVSEFSAPVTACLKVKHFTTTAYNPKTYSEVERFKKLVVERIQHYIAQHQADLD